MVTFLFLVSYLFLFVCCNSLLNKLTFFTANAQSNSAGANIQTSVPGKPVVSMPATNLNIGMDLWNASPAASGATKMRPNPSCASSGVVPAGLPEQWIQVWTLQLFVASFLSICLKPCIKIQFLTIKLILLSWSYQRFDLSAVCFSFFHVCIFLNL